VLGGTNANFLHKCAKTKKILKLVFLEFDVCTENWHVWSFTYHSSIKRVNACLVSVGLETTRCPDTTTEVATGIAEVTVVAAAAVTAAAVGEAVAVTMVDAEVTVGAVAATAAVVV
jgi:hypothetical protein